MGSTLIRSSAGAGCISQGDWGAAVRSSCCRFACAKVRRPWRRHRGVRVPARLPCRARFTSNFVTRRCASRAVPIRVCYACCWSACGDDWAADEHAGLDAWVTDLRRVFTGLSALVQTKLEQSPFSGHVFVFRGRRGDLIKVLWWMGMGCVCLPSGWSADVLSGRRRRAARFR